MKIYAPDYYNDFKCIADKCKHSCCVGWEIDIDNDTYERYMSLSSDIGEKLRKNITSLEPHSFKLREGDRCPFLNENGLCELILELGEDALCDICTLHPRFRNFFADRTELGLGLCCEAVCSLVLTKKTPSCLVVVCEDSDEEACDEYELELLSLRNELLKITTDRSQPLSSRINKACEMLEICESVLSLNEYEDAFASLEYMDENNRQMFTSLNLNGNLTDEPLEQLVFYFVYRYLALSVDEFDVKRRFAFAVVSAKMIDALTHRFPPEESARLYSSEIEYNEENVETLLNIIEEKIGGS